MLGATPRQLVMLAIVLACAWTLVTPPVKALLLWNLKSHLGLVLLFAVETTFVAWLLEWRKRAALVPMLLAAYFLNHWVAEGLPSVLPLESGGFYYASVLTPLAALFGVRFWQAIPSVSTFGGQQG